MFLTSITRLFVICLSLSSLAMLQGCSSGGANTRFYVLDPMDRAAALTTGAESLPDPSVEIISLSLPQYLERPQIVTRNTPNELNLAEFHQWGGSLRQNMLRILAKNLSLLLDTPDISISRRDPKSPAAFRVRVEVHKFERDPDGRVRLTAQWRLLSGRNQGLLAARITDLESSIIIEEADYGAIVSAMGSMMGELSVVIGNEILNHIRP